MLHFTDEMEAQRVNNEPKHRLTASSQSPDSYAIQTPVLCMPYCTTRDA